MVECKDAQKHSILEFLILNFYSEKPTRVIIIIGNIIFGALEVKQLVD